MRAWIWDNKDWLFSGLGVLLLTVVGAALRKLFTRKEQARSVMNSAFDFNPITMASPEPQPLWIWRIVERIPMPGFQTWAWKHIYTPTRIATAVRLRISGGEHGMRFYRAEEASTVSVSLHVINFTPFPITVDRIVGDIGVANGSVAPFNHMRRVKVAKLSDEISYFEVPLSQQQIRRTYQLYKQGRTGSVNAILYLTTEFGEVEIRVYLKTGNTEFVNFHLLESAT